MHAMATQFPNSPAPTTEARFDAMMREHESLVRGAVYGVLGVVDELDDVAQQVWLKAWRHCDELFTVANPAGWLYRVARRTALDAIRSRQRKRSLWDRLKRRPMQTVADAADTAIQQEEHSRLVREAIETLSDKYRTIIILRVFELMSYKAIAETLSIPEATVEMRLFRARKQLRDKLRQRGVL
jgi:RNA polymerase sigma factor (sigma-70 family)